MSDDLIVTVDRDLCIGNGMCRALAPTAFAEDQGGQSIALNPSHQDRPALMEAASCCPVGAISLRERESGDAVDLT